MAAQVHFYCTPADLQRVRGIVEIVSRSGFATRLVSEECAALATPAVLLATHAGSRCAWFAALVADADPRSRLVMLDDARLPPSAAPMINLSGWPSRSADAALDTLLAWLRAVLEPAPGPEPDPGLVTPKSSKPTPRRGTARAPRDADTAARIDAPSARPARLTRSGRRAAAERWTAPAVLAAVVLGVVALAWLGGGEEAADQAEPREDTPTRRVATNRQSPQAATWQSDAVDVAVDVGVGVGVGVGVDAGAGVRRPPALAGSGDASEADGAVSGAARCVSSAGALRLAWARGLEPSARLRLPLRDCAVRTLALR